MALFNQRTGQLGVNVVERIVLKDLASRWQPIDGHNDDGTDGLIFLEDEAGEATGQIVFAQIKCWDIKPSKGIARISLDLSKFEAQLSRWSKVAGAAILIWVNPRTLTAHWTNLRSKASREENIIKVPVANKLGAKSRKLLEQLCGTIGSDGALPTIVARREDVTIGKVTKPLKAQAREAYKTFGIVASADPLIGPVSFARVGWKHFTRKKRPIIRVTQSLELIKVAKRIVEEVADAQLVRRLQNESAPAEIYALTARVIFPNRDPAVVRVILLRQLAGPRVASPRTWFYSVYERRRRRALRGEHHS